MIRFNEVLQFDPAGNKVRETGKRYWFEYHCLESETSSDAIAWHHTHQQCTVLHRHTDENMDEEITGYIYRVRFDDGVEWDVFADELLDSPNEFERPDYKP